MHSIINNLKIKLVAGKISKMMKKNKAHVMNYLAKLFISSYESVSDKKNIETFLKQMTSITSKESFDVMVENWFMIIKAILKGFKVTLEELKDTELLKMKLDFDMDIEEIEEITSIMKNFYEISIEFIPTELNDVFTQYIEVVTELYIEFLTDLSKDSDATYMTGSSKAIDMIDEMYEAIEIIIKDDDFDIEKLQNTVVDISLEALSLGLDVAEESDMNLKESIYDYIASLYNISPDTTEEEKSSEVVDV